MFASILVVLALAGSIQGSPLTDGAMPDTAAAVATFPPETEGDDIMHHILDERVLKTPFGYVNLPDAHSWQVGPLDMTPTKYVVYLWITAVLVLLLILPAARSAKRRREGDAPSGGQNVVETMILFFRDQVIMPNIGHGGEKFAPFILTLFFFILTANLLGLIPYGGSVTASISVTGALASHRQSSGTDSLWRVGDGEHFRDGRARVDVTCHNRNRRDACTGRQGVSGDDLLLEYRPSDAAQDPAVPDSVDRRVRG